MSDFPAASYDGALERTADGLYRAGLPLRMISGGPDRAPTIQERAP